MIDMNDVIKITDDNRINDLVTKLETINNLSQNMIKQNEKCITNYNLAIPHLIKQPNEILYEKRIVKSRLTFNGPKEALYSMCLSDKGITRECNSEYFSNGSHFKQFSQLTKITDEDYGFSFMHAITQDRAYEPLLLTLTDEGIIIFNKLVEKYNSISPPVITELKQYYRISKVTEAERNYFGIATQDARVFFKSFGDSVVPFIANSRWIKDTNYPTFAYRVFMDAQQRAEKHPNTYLPEKIFILNHYDEILLAINSYYNFIKYNTQKHIDFFDYANELVQKYAILGKL